MDDSEQEWPNIYKGYEYISLLCCLTSRWWSSCSIFLRMNYSCFKPPKKLFTRKQWEWVVWWFCWQREATSPHFPAHEDVSQSPGQTSINQPGAQTHGTASQDQRQHRQGTDGWEPQQWWEPSSQAGMYSTWMNNTHVVSCKYVDNGVDNNQHFLYYQNFRTVTCLQPFPCFLSTLVWSTCSENILYSNKVTMNLPL